MTSSAETLKRQAAGRRVARTPTSCPVSINGTTPAMSYRRDDARLARSHTVPEDFSTPERPAAPRRTIARTSWPSSATSWTPDTTDYAPPLSLQPIFVDLAVASDLPSPRSRQSVAADRSSSKVSPSDIIRLADLKLDRHRRATAAAAARRRFVLQMTAGGQTTTTTSPERSKNRSPVASAAGQTEEVAPKSNPSPRSTSLPAVPVNDVCVVLPCTTCVDLEATLDDDGTTRLEQQSFFRLTGNTRIPLSVRGHQI